MSVGSHLSGVLKEAVAMHPDAHHTCTAGACSINSEVREDRAVTPAGPLDDGVLTHCVPERQQKSILITITPAQQVLTER